MPRWSMLLIFMFAIASLIVLDPAVRARAFDTWDAVQPVLSDIKEGLTIIFHEITNIAPDIPSQNIPPIDDGPVYNTYLGRLPV